MAGRSLILLTQGGDNVANFSTNNTTWFWAPVQSRMNGTSAATEAQMAVTVRKDATVSKAKLRIITNGRTTNCTVRSRKNGADGNILITVAGKATGWFEDLSNSDSLTAGDTYCFAFATLGSGGNIAVKALVAQLQSASGNAHLYAGSGDSPVSFGTASSTIFHSWTNDEGGSTSESDNSNRIPVPCAGTFSNMAVSVNANPRTSDSTLRFRVNGANGNQVLTIPAGTTGEFEDTTNSDTIAEGDLCGFALTNGLGTGNLQVRRWNVMFVGTDDETPYISGVVNNLVGAGTTYGSVSGNTEPVASESDVQIPVSFACTMRRLTGRMFFGSGGGTFRTRINGANGNGLATAGSGGNTTVQDTSNTDTLADGDLINVSITISNTSNAHFQGIALKDELAGPTPAVGTRATQAGGYVGVITDSEGVRATQVGGYLGVQVISEGVRATQVAGYAGRYRQPELRATMVGGYVGIRYLVPGCLTNEAQCWRIERTDGQVFRFTSHDKTVTFRGEAYTPCASLLSSALQTSAEFGATENMDLSGVIASGQISRGDLWSGKFDGATVEVWRVDWSDPTKADLMVAGQCGSVEFGATTFTFEVTTAGERLQQRPILQPYMPTCRFKLGDVRCGFDLEAARVSGSVTGVTTPDVRTGAKRRIFTDTSRTEVDNYFQLGRLTWTSGENAGVSVDVKSFASDTFILERPMQYEIQIGDAYTVVPGCDRRFETCRDKFANAINFGGYPHLRGTDDLQETPGFKQ